MMIMVHIEKSGNQPDDRMFFGINALFLFGKEKFIRHFKSDDQQHPAENVKEPGEPLDQGAGCKNENKAHYDGAQDAPEQYPFIILGLYVERQEDHDDHKNIVDRK